MRTVEHVEEIFQGPLHYDFDVEKLNAAVEVLAEAGAVVCPALPCHRR